ncbi:Uncharacterised protein [Escherichia coli]|nr:Uncharacterised protein [Escherichia coli]
MPFSIKKQIFKFTSTLPGNIRSHKRQASVKELHTYINNM